jgi:thiamine-phosphate pyrophosphorylase
MRPVLCMITDRRRYGSAWRTRLVEQVAAAARSGVALIQVRERDLDGGELLMLVSACVAAVRGTAARVLVNDRVDVALAAGAHGVHLPAAGAPAPAVRSLVPRPLLIGRSMHTLAEAQEAEAAGEVDYLLFGTVFESASKPGVPPAGVAALATVAASVALPVLAVGGVTAGRVVQATGAGAAGIAAITLFAGTSTFDTLGAVP